MGNIISTNVSEEVEKIPTDMKKIITNASLKFTHKVCSHGIQDNSNIHITTHVANPRKGCLPTRIYPVQLKKIFEDILKFTQKKVQ